MTLAACPQSLRVLPAANQNWSASRTLIWGGRNCDGGAKIGRQPALGRLEIRQIRRAPVQETYRDDRGEWQLQRRGQQGRQSQRATRVAIRIPACQLRPVAQG